MFSVQVIGIRSIIFREFNRVGSHYIVKNGSCIHSRTVVSFKYRSHVHIKNRCAGKAYTNITQQIETVNANVIVEVLRFIFFQDTSIFIVAGRQIVTNHFTTTTYVQVIVLVVGVVLEHFSVPVNIRISIFVQTGNGIRNFLSGIIRSYCGVVVELCFIVQVHISNTVNCFGNLGRHRETRFVAERYLRSTFYPFFRGNHDNPVSTLGPIQSSCGSIFQHGKLFDVIRFYTSQVIGRYFKTIQQNQRTLSITESGNPTNEEFCVIFTRFTRTLIRDHPCHTTCKCSGQVRRGNFQLFGVDSVD